MAITCRCRGSHRHPDVRLVHRVLFRGRDPPVPTCGREGSARAVRSRLDRTVIWTTRDEDASFFCPPIAPSTIRDNRVLVCASVEATDKRLGQRPPPRRLRRDWKAPDARFLTTAPGY